MGKYYGVTCCSSKSELTHHGIKGQHWGVRRFQNEDGTLTVEGRERYGVGEEQLKKNGDDYIETVDGKKIAVKSEGLYSYMSSSKEAADHIRDLASMAKKSARNMDKEAQAKMKDVLNQYENLAKEVSKMKFEDIDLRKLKKAEKMITDLEMQILTEFTRRKG